MTKLSVNINKVATIRNARGENLPDVFKFAIDCERFGADGITIHPRPDERHIKFSDVELLSTHFPNSSCEFNIEGYPSDDFVKMVLKSNPTQVTLVPDPPHVLTSSQGWDTHLNFEFLKDIISEFRNHNIRVSLFMDTDLNLLDKAKELQAERIEFYTGTYATMYSKNKELAVLNCKKAYLHCKEIGLEVNAGHDLNLENLKYLKDNMPHLKEVSIGHALISDCLYYGLQNVIPMYKRLLID